MLRLILRWGDAGAAIVAVLTAALVGAALWAGFGVLAIVAGVAAGLVLYVIARSYVEIVRIVTEMLVPH